ncbi:MULTISPECIES: HPr(Ser) kinase/phosphatase [unclassified Lactobacillus]|uniref:HPr(Ser) kinase/phosphatase n=1 Tax=unclassified Lactobacillus TaxID=2620435 RepID=UPI000EFDA3B8|nr:MULTISPECIES: HPr(Ser) kinase/phosphatase [unclassified Lactobacillus]RMC24989.1 HPr kinase/phosphorylase [Lactobacillus sp. ESL0247]RMC29144.1 HPr kinase/phosphorylase [Lactobacillus sp. ESL0246]RMC32747.1 HPr kinase/phosphorylase [Lactobacillus sp. ESL0245]
MANAVKLKDLIQDNKIVHIVHGKQYITGKEIAVSDIYRPGLELTGYFDFYPNQRIQLLGRTEISYAARLDHESLVCVFKKLCTPQTPCFFVSRSLRVPQELVVAAEAAKIPILSVSESTTYISSILTEYLRERLAIRETIHGVMVEVKGLGILLTGDSGVGKSETALGLIRRGHRLIADDRVDAYQQDTETVMGEPPQILKHIMEIRGIGIINVMELFGVGAVKNRGPIQLVIKLVNWDNNANYDRLGFEESSRDICNVEVPQITIPVKVGRNMEDIIEVAAMNFRAKKMGYNATKTFDDNLTALIAQNSKKDK